MSLDPARDENTKWNGGIFVEECEHAVDQVADFFFIFALVQAVDDDEKWMSC